MITIISGCYHVELLEKNAFDSQSETDVEVRVPRIAMQDSLHSVLTAISADIC